MKLSSLSAIRFLSFFFVASLLGCARPNEQPTAQVKGKVELDGKPMATGKIFFEQPGLPQDVLEVKDGNFEGKAKIGKAKIAIASYRPGKIPDMYKDTKDKDAFLENIIPAAYNRESKISAEVTSSGPNEFKFEAKSK